MSETFETGTTSTDVDLQDLAAGLAVPGAEDDAAPDLPVEGATDPGLTDAAPTAGDVEDAEELSEELHAAVDTIDPDDPFSGPGDWYVVHTYSGYENKVKRNLESRIQFMEMQDRIFAVVIPMEDVMEIKGGKKQVVQRKVFPGYLLVKMIYDNDSWYVVRNTPGVTGFVGMGNEPTPLRPEEVAQIIRRMEAEAIWPSRCTTLARCRSIRCW